MTSLSRSIVINLSSYLWCYLMGTASEITTEDVPSWWYFTCTECSVEGLLPASSSCFRLNLICFTCLCYSETELLSFFCIISWNAEMSFAGGGFCVSNEEPPISKVVTLWHNCGTTLLGYTSRCWVLRIWFWMRHSSLLKVAPSNFSGKHAHSVLIYTL